RMVGATKPDTKATLQVWRRGKTVDLNLTVGVLEADEGPARRAPGKQGGSDSADANELGLAVADLTADERSKLGISGGVRVVRAEGVAASAGVTPGDIVLGLNEAQIDNARQFN